jgi:hypothetical protein
MKERPIIFSAPMVRAILGGTKTQTRRALAPDLFISSGGAVVRMASAGPATTGIREAHCPYWRQPGDRLWVREAWSRDEEDGALFYRADVGTGNEADDWQRNIDDGASGYRWKPSIFMPRCASRILLDVTDVRVERLHDISEADAIAEGVNAKHTADASYTARESYAVLWEQINGPGSWDATPWVWVIEFKRVTP